MSNFDTEYKRLNKHQKEAVDTIEGPVMVIAGPGTGKTQVISLRIGNILKSTDTGADSILCLTFTNSGVEAMRTRLRGYIGPEALKVEVSTFHAFGMRLIEEHYHVLGLSRPPKLLDAEGTLSIADRILSENEWHYIRPRNNAALYFRDLKSLVSLLIRERLSPEDFLDEIQRDMSRLKDDPDNISSRGARKGELKMEVVNKIEGLEKTCEVVTFYRLYEEAKAESNVMDYDDVLRYMVDLVSKSDEVRDTVREKYLYILVDEHQDSSGVQNDFLKAVWGDVESPNVFVVGDDRQLIYGFSGASLSYFEEFKSTFGAKVITLTNNYRSTQRILDAAEALLQSNLAEGKLVSHLGVDYPLELVECEYPRDEVLSAGNFFIQRIAEGAPAEECALLVPKNSHVRSAAMILRDMGLVVSATGSMRLFDVPEARSFVTLLRIISNPYSGVDIAESLLDPLSGVPTLEAHAFLHKVPSRSLSIQSLIEVGASAGLLSGMDPVYTWGKRLEKAIELAQRVSLYELIQHIGKEFLLDGAPEHEVFVRRVEVIRSFLHLTQSIHENNDKSNVRSLVEYLGRIEAYGEDLPLAIFAAEKGIRVMTLHASKGLEFDAVWIAHMNERSLMSNKMSGFALPDRVKLLEEKKDEMAAKREVYVALTRAKHMCVLSYARTSHKGGDERLASIIEALPTDMFVMRTSAESEKLLLAAGPEQVVTRNRVPEHSTTRDELKELVKANYAKKKVSVTLLNNFYECPWKWYFRSFLEVPEPLSESLEFGSAVHSAIEYLLKLGKKPTQNDIHIAIEKALEKSHIVGEQRLVHMRKSAEAAIDRYVTRLLPTLYDIKESEKSFSYKESLVPHLVINGKVDLLEYGNDGGIRVTDFKTGKTRTPHDIEKLDNEGRLSTYMRQLAMYSYLINGVMKSTHSVEASRLYFVGEARSKEACYETVVDSEQIGLLQSDIVEYDKLLSSGMWMERPCNHRSYPGESDCPYCKRAEMYM